MSALLEEIEGRLRWMYEALARGDDVAPATRLRAEGLMQAAVLTGEAAEAELSDTLARVWREVYGDDPSESLGDDWRGFYPFPQIPALAPRAPVYPGTSD